LSDKVDDREIFRFLSRFFPFCQGEMNRQSLKATLSDSREGGEGMIFLLASVDSFPSKNAKLRKPVRGGLLSSDISEGVNLLNELTVGLYTLVF